MVDLSSPADARLPRTWIALLRGKVRASLAATTGVEVSADLASYLLAGADVVMTTSALLRHGPQYATELLDGLSSWMRRKGLQTAGELRGKLSAPDRAWVRFHLVAEDEVSAGIASAGGGELVAQGRRRPARPGPPSP